MRPIFSASLLTVYFCASLNIGQATPPAWWTDGEPPVINPSAAPNNLGAANIGQAKWMAKKALEALRAQLPTVADEVEADLVGAGKPIASWNAPITPEEQAAQKAPLLIGQLKAISTPFYFHLNDSQSAWLAAERIANGTNQSGTHLPWSEVTTDDNNKGMAVIGQLKAVFSLRFEGLDDSDSDGMPDWMDRYPNDYYNRVMPRLSVAGSMEVEVLDQWGNSVVGAPLRFVRTEGSGSFAGGLTEVFRSTPLNGKILIADYTGGASDRLKVTLNTSTGEQIVWLPAGGRIPNYSAATGGGVLNFTNPFNEPYVEVDDPNPESEMVMDISNYINYNYLYREDISEGYVTPLYREWEFSYNAATRIHSSRSVANNGIPTTATRFFALGESLYFNGGEFSGYHRVSMGNSWASTIDSNMSLSNIPTGFSSMDIQMGVEWRIQDDNGSLVFQSPIAGVDLTLTTANLTNPFSVAGFPANSYISAVFGPFISEVSWEELENNEVELGVDGSRVIQFTRLTNTQYYDNNWKVSSTNPDISVTFVDDYDFELGATAAWNMRKLKIKHEGDNANSESEITLQYCWGNQIIVQKKFNVVLTSAPIGPAKVITSSITNDEAASPLYRKIGLTGVPLSDEKPQAKEETDEETEETYVDALTQELRHSTTDVYVPVPASQLSLSVRRNAAAEIWSYGSGLKPEEDPTLAFGPSWRSNLGGHIRIVEQTNAAGVLVARMDPQMRRDEGVGQSDPNYAYVTDEDGSTHRFAIGYTVNFESPEGVDRYYVPMPTSRHEQDGYQVSLGYDPVSNVFEFRRKHGNVLRFSGSASIAFSLTADRLAGSKQYQSYRYHRLNTVSDRFGNQLNYSYLSNNLIPHKISVQGRSDLAINIQQNAQGRVTEVFDVNGKEISYEYDDNLLPLTSSGVLQKITIGAEETAHYTYEGTVEEDYRQYAIGTGGTTILPWDRRNPASAHQYHVKTGQINLASIKDNLDNVTSFSYDWDKSYYISTKEATYDFAGEINGKYIGNYTLSGIPRNVIQISLPGSRTVQITGSESLGRSTTVTDAAGNTRTYRWSGQVTEVIDQNSLGYAFSDSHITTAKLNYFTQMKITHALGGEETFKFDHHAGLALEEVIDHSNNVTKYGHGEDLNGGYIGFGPTVGGATILWHPEPTSETDATNQKTRYAYGNYRIMTVKVDPYGTRTETQLDTGVNAMGRRMNEIVKDPQGNVLKKTEFAYHSNTKGVGFPNFMVRQTVENTGAFTAGDPPWVKELTTLYEPDPNGRLAAEIIDMNANRVKDGGDLVTTYIYDRSGNKLSTTDPGGLTTWFNYDNRHRLVGVTYADGTKKEIVYDGRSKKVLEIDERGIGTGFVYDGGGRLVKTVRDMNGNLNFAGGIHSGIDAGVDIITEVSYNNINLPIQSTDPLGYLTKTEYDHLQRPVKIYTPGPTRAVGVVPNSEVTDQLTELFYDGPNSGSSCFNVSGFKPTRTKDPRGYETLHIYDDLYRLTESRVQYSLSPAHYAKTVHTFDPIRGVQTDTKSYRDPVDASGNATGGQLRFSQKHTDYDALYRPQTVTEGYGTALAQQTINDYTATGFVHHTSQQLTATENAETDTQYDVAGRVVMTTGPPVTVPGIGGTQRPTTITTYTPSGQVAQTTDARNNVTQFRYDARKRVIHQISPQTFDAELDGMDFAITTTSYDPAGNVVAVTNPLGDTTNTVYDNANRATDIYAPAVTDPVSQEQVRPHTEQRYDFGGHIVKLIDANGSATVNTYDPLGRLATTKTNPTVVASAIAHADDILVTNTYDKANNLTQVKDGEDQITEFVFDGLNRRTQTKWDAADIRIKTESVAYDALLQISSTDARTWTVEQSYDARFRLTGITSTTRPDDNETRTYDLAGRLLTSSHDVSPVDPRNVAYQYDKLGRTTQETSAGATHEYGYDLNGNRTLVHYLHTGRALRSTYDALNRVTTIVEEASVTGPFRNTEYFYDVGGNVLTRAQANDTVEESAYDALGRRTFQRTRIAGSSNPISSFTYRHDLVGNVVRIDESQGTSSLPDRRVTNLYDRAYRLTEEQLLTLEGTSELTTTSYGYDKANNRHTKTVAVSQGGVLQSSSTDIAVYGNPTNGKNSNQLHSYEEGATSKLSTYSYDANGNRSEKTINAVVSETYEWDSFNRLVEVEQLVASKVYYYGYDHRTRRVVRDESAAGGVLVKSSFSGGTAAFEIGTTGLVVEYIRGSDWGGGVGGVLYTVRGGNLSFNAYNSRGDVVAQTNGLGTVTWQASYEAYGTRTAETGSTEDRQKANTKEEDPTGLLNEGFRYRDLATGLFISRDPAGFVDGPNVYTYVRQNPWSKFDPDGLRAETAKETKELKQMDEDAKNQRDSSREFKNQAKKETDQSKREGYNKKAMDAEKKANSIEASAKTLREIVNRMTDESPDISDVISGKVAPWIREAAGEMNVREWENGWNPRIKEFQESVIKGYFTDDGGSGRENAWCAAFVNWCLQQTGQPTLKTNDSFDPMRAKKYMSYGNPSGANFGSFGIMKGSHIGIVVGTDKNGNVLMLGGNQADSVNITVFGIGEFQGFRRPPGVVPPNPKIDNIQGFPHSGKIE